MKSLSPFAKAFVSSDEGATGVEFSIMFALLLGACIAVIKTLAIVGVDQF
jgi:Flp pilus assembly protein TadG